ncbi:TolC family protein [Puteibacter caeruleilacunae]|nr:TolC family protein [Puteibacter caeruleilacunae]
MFKIKLVFGIMFSLIITIASAQQENINKYLSIAAENNAGLKSIFNEYMAALEVAPQAKALPDPQLAFGYFISPVETREGPMQFKISASQFFPWFGTLKHKEHAANETAKSKYERFEESKAKLFNEVKGIYFNLYFNQKAIDITLENIDIIKTFQRLVTVKIESGNASIIDEYRIQMEINELENQLALLKDKKFALEAMFLNLLNSENMIEIVLPDNLWQTDFPLTRQAALDSIAMYNHQLLALDYQQASLAYKKKVAELSAKPNIKIGIDYTAVGKGDNNLSGKDAFLFPTIGITIPLYKNKYKARIQEAIHLEAAKSYEKQDKQNLMANLFEEGWKDYQDANRRIRLFEMQHDLALKSIKVLETDYTTGKESFEEVLRMERKVLKYHLEKEKAIADKQAAISYLNYLMGKSSNQRI